jgi:hypothetical protein
MKYQRAWGHEQPLVREWCREALRVQVMPKPRARKVHWKAPAAMRKQRWEEIKEMPPEWWREAQRGDDMTRVRKYWPAHAIRTTEEYMTEFATAWRTTTRMARARWAGRWEIRAPQRAEWKTWCKEDEAREEYIAECVSPRGRCWARRTRIGP